MARIALMTIGLGGHIGPALRLGAVLVRQGHEVIAWAPARYRRQIELAGLRFQRHEPLATRRPWVSLVGFTAILAEATDRSASQIIEQLFDHDVELVIHDSHAPWGRVGADFLGLPRIASDPLFPFQRDDFSNAGSPQLGVSNPAWLSSIDAHHVSDALAEIEVSRRSVGQRWGVDLGNWHDILVSRAPATVRFTTDRILGAVVPGVGWSCVGPLMCPSPPREKRGAQPLVYVAFGTFFSVRREPFDVVIEALAAEPFVTMISTGAGGLTAADFGPLPENIKVHDFVDSRDVLARATVHVTHGGGSSVHESLMAGVPMVCLPQGSDQPAWSRRVEDLGAGRIVEETPEAIRSAVHRMLADEQAHAQAGELRQHLISFDGEARVAEVVAATLRSHGPSRAAR